MRRTTTSRGYGAGWRRRSRPILIRDRGICHWCRLPGATSVDHVVPKIEGGTDHPANLVAAHIRCNSRRSLAWVRKHRAGGRGKGRGGGRRSAERVGALAGGAGAAFMSVDAPVTSSPEFPPTPTGSAPIRRRRPPTGALAR
jgi:5-methylcytosine-specific restriction protein A